MTDEALTSGSVSPMSTVGSSSTTNAQMNLMSVCCVKVSGPVP